MPLIRQPIPALYGGVSQQAAVVRSANQCEDAINCWFSVAEGACKRPPLEAIGMFKQGGSDQQPFYAWINDPQSRALVLELPGDGSFNIYFLGDGNKITATNDTGNAYLTVSANANVAFRAINVEGTVYIVNRTIKTAAAADEATGTIAGTAQTLQDTALDSAAEGSIWKIVGDAGNTFDAYYAKKVDGKFVEWIQPGDQFHLDPETMPHAITFDPVTGSATFGPVTWADKLVGDEKSNPFPSFTGYAIDNLFFTHDRLGFLTGGKVSMSEVGKYTNFFATSVYDILDSDRIDITVASTSKTNLRSARPIHKSTILFSDDKEFSMDAEPIFSPRTINVTEATSYPASANCDPTNAGPNIYFPTDAGKFTHLREMYVEDQSVKLDAANVTAHVPRYVPDQVNICEAHPNMDIVVLHSLRTPSSLYAYQYFWQGDEKAQSAWNRWDFKGIKILSAKCILEWLYVAYEYEGDNGLNRYLGRINLKFGDEGIAVGFDHPVHLDQLTATHGSYNSTENRTYFDVPFPVGSSALWPDLVMVMGDGMANFGTLITTDPDSPKWVNVMNGGTKLWLAGDYSQGTVMIGLKYNQSLTLSEQFYQAQDRAGLNCRLQLRNLTVAFANTAFFNVTVTVRGHDPSMSSVVPGLTGTYTARTLGDAYFLLNRPQLASGKHRFPILAQSSDAIITLSNDSYLPANWQTAEWEGMVTIRTRG